MTTLSRNLPFNGGFCRWYYTPRENIAAWPEIDPLTQQLRNEPTLIQDAKWCGPVRVPNYALGFEEPITRGKPGISYKQQVSGVYPGDSAGSRVNLENMPYYEFIVVGKMRAGGLYLILGTPDGGMQFDATYASGGGSDNAGSKIVFTIDSLFKGLILPSFLPGDTILPPDGTGTGTGGEGGGGGNVGQNDFEIIDFENVSEVLIPWTADFNTRFGVFPLIEVWFDTPAGPTGPVNIPIMADQDPPNTTLFTIEFGGNASGFVIIK